MASPLKISSKERGTRAVKEMKACGFTVSNIKVVLKRLLKLFDNNWDMIEADNYSILVDSLISSDEVEEQGFIKKRTDVGDDDDNDADLIRKEELISDETGLYRKRLLCAQSEEHPSPSNCNHEVPFDMRLKKAKVDDPLSEKQIAKNQSELTTVGTASLLLRDSTNKARPASSMENLKGKGIATMDDPATTSRKLVCYKEPKIEPGIQLASRTNFLLHSTANPTEEHCGDGNPAFEVPIAVIAPSVPVTGDQGRETHSSENGSRHQKNSSKVSEQNFDICYFKEKTHDLTHQNRITGDVISPPSTNTEIASSSNGEVKLSLFYTKTSPDFHIPSLETILNVVENQCLKSYKILQPNFSLLNVMKEVCQTALELSESTNQEEFVHITSMMDSLKSSRSHIPFCGGSANSQGLLPHNFVPDRNCNGNGNAENNGSLSLVAGKHHEPALGGVRPLHDANDISKGEERVRIPLINEVNSQCFPPSFFYIPRNIVYQSGHLDFSLARIGDEDCCSDCFGDCLSSSIPCACARETGGEFAYNQDGNIKKEFLDDCLSRFHDPKRHHFLYCKDCPVERSKNDAAPAPCKGHLERKFIKECWVKCGCRKKCGNRVVQRGITCNLQVFFVSEEKCWGLRTLDKLPRGAFVCEYVGEVLTNMELYDRTMRSTGNARHTYPVLLDADWGSEGVLKDEEALCLDATYYGNVARFINHRCYDANLIEIPVEVETPDRHYYHLAFFTNRKVEAFEELTWDYGINFDNGTHPVKAFQCSCGSRFCRNKKRSRRSRSAAYLPK